jgi:hypothetical protein
VKVFGNKKEVHTTIEGERRRAGGYKVRRFKSVVPSDFYQG